MLQHIFKSAADISPKTTYEEEKQLKTKEPHDLHYTTYTYIYLYYT